MYNSIRGTDSTGAASVRRQFKKDMADIVLAKELGHPFNLIQIKRKGESDFEDVLRGQHRALIGHCRASTRGETSRWNAHPFAFQDVVGTHNGTLEYTSWNKLLGRHKLETDSECIFNEIQASSLQDTVSKFSDKDAYALVWYDGRNNSINFLRNDKRPLFYAFSKDGKMIFWSSEFYHLICGMHLIPHEEKFVYELPVDMHYSWAIPDQDKAFGKAHVVKREAPKAPLVAWSGHTSGTKSHNESTTQGSFSSYGSNVSHLERAWKDSCSGFFKRYSRTTNRYEYSQLETGPFYPSVEQCWDSLTEVQQTSRKALNHIPVEVKYRRDKQKDDGISYEQPKLAHMDVIKDQLKQKQLDRVAPHAGSCPMVWSDGDKAVYWNIKEQQYDIFEHKGFKDGWEKFSQDICPDYVPFTDLDIAARHQFLHTGRKKKKVTSFRWFRGSLLVQESFEKVMAGGCLECKRTPHWGNDVTPVSQEAFLCEHCARNTKTLAAWRAVAKA